MQPLLCIPQDLLFSCMTGTTNLSNRAAIKIFICSGVKLTCRDMYRKVDLCWVACLEELSRNWKNSIDLRNTPKDYFIHEMHHSFQFVFKWIKGKPKITHQFQNTFFSQDFSLKFNADEERKVSDLPHLLPLLWTSQQNSLGFPFCLDFTNLMKNIAGYNRGSPHEDLAFIDLDRWQLNKEMKARDWFIRTTIPPIYYDKGVFLLFSKTQSQQYELHFYSFEKKDLELKTTFSINVKFIHSMNLLDDHIVFILHDKIAAVSIDNLRNSGQSSLIYSEEIEWRSFLHSFKDQILLYKEGQDREVSFQMLSIEDRKLKLNDCVLIGDKLTKTMFFDCTHAFHFKSQYSIFLFQESRDQYKLGTVSPGKLEASASRYFHMHPISIEIGKLVPFKDVVLLCSKNAEKKLQINLIEITEGKIDLKPLLIQGQEDMELQSISGTYSHLDKLFIIGYFKTEKGYAGLYQYYLTIIDMVTKRIESTYPLGSCCIQNTSFISSSLGKIHILIPEINNPYILKVDYT